MATDRVINKVLITEEAEFDYEIMFGRQIPRADIKQESETYIDNRIGKGNLQGYYIRAKYYDETADQMLMLFFYKGSRLCKMQVWELVGICQAAAWDEELEESGRIRAWLTSKLNPKESIDWVLNLREAERRGVMGGMPTYRLIGLSREAENAIYNGTDTEILERLSHIQRKGGDWSGYRKYLPRRRKIGKSNKRP